jgi:hypothetical protein
MFDLSKSGNYTKYKQAKTKFSSLKRFVLLPNLKFLLPNMEFFNDFENFIKVIDNENKEIIITGDFNCDMLDSNYRNNNSK